MKQMKSFLTLALALTALAGCNKENEIPGMNPDATGVPTYAAFTVKVKSAENTRTTDEATGDVVEQTVGSVRLFIFNDAGVLENREDLTFTSGSGSATAAIKTTTGQKTIYAVVNAKTDMTVPVGSTLAAFKALAVKAGTTSSTPDDNIASTGAFAMIGKVTPVLQEHTTSGAAESAAIPISVSRGAAKVQMQYDPDKVTQNESLHGTFSQPKYLVAQMNKTMFLPREQYEQTPNGATAGQADGNTDGTYDHLTTVPADMNDGKAAAATWDNTFANSFYTAENVNEAPVTGNTTFVLVELKYTPVAADFSGATQDPGTDFWGVVDKRDNTMRLYAIEQEANKVAEADAENLKVKKYTDGLCYYRVNIKDISKTTANEKYSVLRNNYYKVNIVTIRSVGGNTPNDPDIVVPETPGTPLETETFISATITVVPWNPIIMNEPLG